MSDMTDKMSGRMKQMAGKATDNKKLEMKGKMQHDMAELRHKTKKTLHNVSKKLHSD